MDYSTIFLLFSFLLTFIYVLTISSRSNTRLPRGPYPLPIIENLLKLGHKPHRSLAKLSKLYGPLMLLKFGSRTTIVVSSPNVAKEFFHTNDISFSSRSIPDVGRLVDHDKYTIVRLPVGDQWRRLRRISREFMFSVQCLDKSEVLRGEKVRELLDHVNQCCTNKKNVNLGGVAFTTTLNVLFSFMFSMDFGQYHSTSSQEFKEAVWGLMEVSGKPNLPDFFPILKPFDPQGLLRRGNFFGEKLLTIIDRIIDQRLQSRSGSSPFDGVSSTNNDVLDSLLNLIAKGESLPSRDDMRHLFLALFTAGTNTTSSTLEWAMAEFIHNP